MFSEYNLFACLKSAKENTLETIKVQRIITDLLIQYQVKVSFGNVNYMIFNQNKNSLKQLRSQMRPFSEGIDVEYLSDVISSHSSHWQNYY